MANNLNFSSLLSPKNLSIQTLTNYIDGQLDQIANNFYANASHILIGNTSLSSIITSDGVTTNQLNIGDTTSNVTVNSTAIMLDSFGSTNTYIDAYQAIFSGVVTALRGINISGSLLDNAGNAGNTGDVLTANGPGLYWSSSANNALNLGGLPASTYALQSTFDLYQTIAGLPTAVSYLTANNTTYVGTVTAANVVSNSQLQSNLANYQTLADLSANVINLTSNNSNYLGGIPAASYLNKYVNNTITGVYHYSANLYADSTLISNNMTVNTFTITGAIYANSIAGEKGLVLTSNGNGGTYWSDVTNYSGGIFDGGNPFSSYIDQPRLDAGGVY